MHCARHTSAYARSCGRRLHCQLPSCPATSPQDSQMLCISVTVLTRTYAARQAPVLPGPTSGAGCPFTCKSPPTGLGSLPLRALKASLRACLLSRALKASRWLPFHLQEPSYRPWKPPAARLESLAARLPVVLQPCLCCSARCTWKTLKHPAAGVERDRAVNKLEGDWRQEDRVHATRGVGGEEV